MQSYAVFRLLAIFLAIFFQSCVDKYPFFGQIGKKSLISCPIRVLFGLVFALLSGGNKFAEFMGRYAEGILKLAIVGTDDTETGLLSAGCYTP